MVSVPVDTAPPLLLRISHDVKNGWPPTIMVLPVVNRLQVNESVLVVESDPLLTSAPLPFRISQVVLHLFPRPRTHFR